MTNGYPERAGVAEMLWDANQTSEGDPIIRTPSSPATRLLAMGTCGINDDAIHESPVRHEFLSGSRDPCIGLRLVRNLTEAEIQSKQFSIPSRPPIEELNLKRDADIATAKGYSLLTTNDVKGAHAAFVLAQLSQSDHNGARIGLAKTLRLELENLKDETLLLSKKQMARDLLCQVLASASVSETMRSTAVTELSLLKTECVGDLK